ncbi:uncharacterized protein [Venturia canescens]|uniref:uncharacterized protein n=1 Tax=Venturia canescens TaxID=32260 RepID=UPI001C9C649D|nr:uncharacterized protein LOC122408220 [Venturia canescens]
MDKRLSSIVILFVVIAIVGAQQRTTRKTVSAAVGPPSGSGPRGLPGPNTTTKKPMIQNGITSRTDRPPPPRRKANSETGPTSGNRKATDRAEVKGKTPPPLTTRSTVTPGKKTTAKIKDATKKAPKAA